MSRATRREVLRRLGASRGEADELLVYNEADFIRPARLPVLPMHDEPFIAAWADYLEEARYRGAVPVLRRRLRQFCFPVLSGISETPAYRAATRRGIQPTGAPGLAFEAPDRVSLFLHQTVAGRIPILVLEHRADFIAAVRAITRRNEPVEVPDAQGGLMIAGYNNWDRIDRLRTLFERGELEVEDARGWEGAFPAVRERRELYQDCLILLCVGPYSAVAAADLGLTTQAWHALSQSIRLEHECAHYVTRRLFGTVGKGILPELIADYAGISSATGRFRADWFLRFLGLEHPSRYRSGGRLERYRGSPPLSDRAFSILQTLLRRAATTVEATENAGPESSTDVPDHRTRMVVALASLTLEDLAAEDASSRLRDLL